MTRSQLTLNKQQRCASDRTGIAPESLVVDSSASVCNVILNQ